MALRAKPILGVLLCLLCLAPASASAIVPEKPDGPGVLVGGTVYTILRAGDTIYIGGSFSDVNGAPRGNLAAISAADGSLTSWAPMTDSNVYALAASGSTIYVGGVFSSVSDTSAHARNGLAAVDTAGTVLPWDPDAGAGGQIYALALHGTRVYVGGSFSTLGTGLGQITENNLGAVDAGSGVAVGWTPNPPSPNGTVTALDVAADGSMLYAGGSFSTIGTPGVSRTFIAAVNASDGSVDANWDPADSANGGFIDAIKVGESGTVYTTGDFFPNLHNTDPSMGFAPRYYAAELAPADGTATGGATPWAGDADFEANAIAPASDAVYLGGSFGFLNAYGTRTAQPRSDLGATDPVTGDVLAWNPAPDNTVHAMALGSDGSLYVGGAFDLVASDVSTDAQAFASFSPPPAATSPPEVQGTPQPGQTLTCTQGTWSGATPQTYSTQLLLDGAPAGTPGSTDYVVQDADVGRTVGCTVSSHNRTADVTTAAANVTIQAAPTPVTETIPTTTPPPPSGLPAPLFLKSANLFPRAGTVLVQLPGSTTPVPLTQPKQIPFGSIIDATRGTVRICTADAKGKVECSDFFGGVFRLTQVSGRPPITVLTLVGGNFRKCPRPNARRSLAEAAKKAKSVRHLWGAGSGSFRTVGRFASATIRGTTWLTDDRCDGTLIRVKAGAVTVRDRVKRKAFTLRAPRKYLAKARSRRA